MILVMVGIQTEQPLDSTAVERAAEIVERVALDKAFPEKAESGRLERVKFPFTELILVLEM